MVEEEVTECQGEMVRIDSRRCCFLRGGNIDNAMAVFVGARVKAGSRSGFADGERADYRLDNFVGLI